MLSQSFGCNAVCGMFGECAQFVEGLAVEVEEGWARGRVGEEAGQASGVAGLEIPAWFDVCEEAEG